MKPPSTLECRTVWVGSRRTSIKLHPTMWGALEEVADRQGKTVHDVVLAIDRERGQTALETAIRVYIVQFFREALHASDAP